MSKINKLEQFNKEQEVLIGKQEKLGEFIEKAPNYEMDDDENLIWNDSDKKNFKKQLDTLMGKSKSLKENKFYVAVAGQVKSGKSTFLNAMIFQDDELEKQLSDFNPCTAKITIIEAKEQEKYLVDMYDNEKWGRFLTYYKKTIRNHCVELFDKYNSMKIEDETIKNLSLEALTKNEIANSTKEELEDQKFRNSRINAG